MECIAHALLTLADVVSVPAITLPRMPPLGLQLRKRGGRPLCEFKCETLSVVFASRSGMAAHAPGECLWHIQIARSDDATAAACGTVRNGGPPQSKFTFSALTLLLCAGEFTPKFVNLLSLRFQSNSRCQSSVTS